jgi:tetratricopeptide (TPR) repeat protein
MKMNSGELKDHVANHLEQLALTSVNGDESSEEDDQEILGSQRWDDTMSEGRTKLEILNDFVEEQLGYIIPEKRGPADKGLNEDNLDFLNDSDEEGSGDEGRPGLSSWKLANYLGSNAGLQSGSRNSRLRVPGASSDLQEPHRSESNNGSLAVIRTGTHPRDDNFVGRDADLANLYKILSVPGRLCVLSGTGGIGKTSTALEYSFRHEQSYSFVFWVQAETQVGCADTFSLIATQLQLDEDGSVIDQKQLIEISRDFLEKTDKRWLLVFDNVDEWTDVEEYIPVNLAQSTGSVLITTRIRDLGPPLIPSNFFHIDMKEMTMDESRRLLIQRMQPNLKYEKMRLHPEWKLAGEIASLAGLPLAMSQIAGYVNRSNISLAEFLELWNEWRGNNPVVALPTEPLAPSYTALETIWSIALSELSAEAHKLLRIMAFLDSDVIQRELLLNDHKSLSLSFLHSKSAMRYRRMIEDLGGRKLISTKKQDGRESYSVHRLLQHRLLQDLEGDEREEVFDMTFQLVRDRLPRPSIDTPDSNKWNVFKEYLPHVLSLQRIFDEALPIMTPFIGLAELFRDGGVHLWQRGLIPDGLRLLNSAEEILDKLDCDEDQLRADINIATALLIQYFGISHRAESRQRFAKILEIRRKFEANAAPGTFTVDDEMRLCNANADYGNALLQFNNYREAEKIYQECDEKYRKWGTEADIPFEYGKFYHHAAFCRMYDKDFKTAIKLSEKAIELVTRGQSDHIQLILRFRFDLACIVLQSGDIERSLRIQEQILKARLSLQGNGKATYFTLQSYYAVGALYAYLGKLDEAEYCSLET